MTPVTAPGGQATQLGQVAGRGGAVQLDEAQVVEVRGVHAEPLGHRGLVPVHLVAEPSHRLLERADQLTRRCEGRLTMVGSSVTPAGCVVRRTLLVAKRFYHTDADEVSASVRSHPQAPGLRPDQPGVGAHQDARVQAGSSQRSTARRSGSESDTQPLVATVRPAES